MLKIRLLLVAAVICAVLAGTVSVSKAHDGGPYLRVANLSLAAGSIDLYINDIVIPALKYPDVTAYQPMEGHQFKVLAVKTGEPAGNSMTKEPLILEFAEGDEGFYTIAAVGSPADDSFILLKLPEDGKLATETAESHELATEKAHVTQGTIEITDAFARPTAMEESTGMSGMDMGKVSGVYLTIKNNGDKAERLIKVECDVAGMAELHETTVTNDVAQMKPIEGGVEIPAGGTVEFAPGGKHIMLMGLKGEIVLGHTVHVTLTFESGTVIALDVPALMG
ncbi:MAG: copper chaperone PCu(A)C [Anaerolineae bacterium]|nr:copper chaperone PCu(A)C [Anaerolineae bacterium]